MKVLCAVPMRQVMEDQRTDSLVKDGKAAAGNVTVIARSGIGVALRKGAPKPDISSPETLKRTLLAAKSITYSNPAAGGASGNHFAKVLPRSYRPAYLLRLKETNR